MWSITVLKNINQLNGGLEYLFWRCKNHPASSDLKQPLVNSFFGSILKILGFTYWPICELCFKTKNLFNLKGAVWSWTLQCQKDYPNIDAPSELQNHQKSRIRQLVSCLDTSRWQWSDRLYCKYLRQIQVKIILKLR